MVETDSDSLKSAVEVAIDVHPLFTECDHFTVVWRGPLAVILHIVSNRIHWDAVNLFRISMRTGGEETYDALNGRLSLEIRPKTECIGEPLFM